MLTPLIEISITFFMKVNCYSTIGEYPRAEHHLDLSINAPTLVRHKKGNDFNDRSSSNISHKISSSQIIDDNQVATEMYVDSLSENNINRRDLSTAFNDHDNEFDNKKLTFLDGISVNRNPTIDKELSKKIIDDELKKKLFSDLINNCKAISE